MFANIRNYPLRCSRKSKKSIAIRGGGKTILIVKGYICSPSYSHGVTTLLADTQDFTSLQSCIVCAAEREIHLVCVNHVESRVIKFKFLAIVCLF